MNPGGGAGGGSDDGSEERSVAEKAVSVVSVLFTLLLFAFLVWQAVSVPADTTPEAHVQHVEALSGDRVGVTVELTNPSSGGLLSATVEVDCGQPPPSVEFTNVPTDGRQEAVLVCPAENASDATANVTVWQTA